MSLHPLIERAARGELPDWANVGEKRRRHMERVATLMGEWAEGLGWASSEVQRARAAGFLHDALRDEDPSRLRPLLRGGRGPEATSLGPRAEPGVEAPAAQDPVEAEGADFPDSLLHGPAAARLLRREGVADEELLRAVAFHTTGHPDLDAMGRLLYLADYLEPKRGHRASWLAELRERMPREREAVLEEVTAERIGRLLGQRWPIPAQTVGLWNRITAGKGGRP